MTAFLHYDAQNGESTYFWLDNWLGTGCLIDKTGDLGPTYLGIPRQTLLSEACTNGEWNIRRRGRRVFSAVYDEIENAGKPISDAGKDVILWRHGDDGF